MAEVLLARDVSTEIWGTETLVATAGSETTSDSYYVDKGVYGPKYISIVFNYTTPGTAGTQVDVQVSQGGVIWHTIRSVYALNTERVEFFAPQGFFRLRCVAIGGAPVLDADCVARNVVDRVVIHSVGEAIGGVTAGACLQFGSAAAPVVQDTANTNFIQGNFDTGATSGSSKGLSIYMVPTGTHSYTKAILGDIRPTVRVGNLAALQGEAILGAAASFSGLGYAVGAYLSFPAATLAAGGNYAAINAELGAPAGADIGAPGAGGATRTSFIRIAITGDATARATVEAEATVFSLVGFTAGAGITEVITTTQLNELTACNAVGFRIGVGPQGGGDAIYYVPMVPEADWN